jgi:hypothetical protein
MKNVILVCVALLLMSCHPEEKKEKATGIETDTVKLPLEYAFIKPDSSQLEHRFTDYDKQIALTEQDLKQIEKIIQKAYIEEAKNRESIRVKPSHLLLVKRQYISYLNKYGERIVWVNAFCKVPDILIEDSLGGAKFQPMDWRKETVLIDDGGSCFWNILINLDTGQSELIFNGQA